MNIMAKSFHVKSEEKGIKYLVFKRATSGYWYIEIKRKVNKSLKTKNAAQAKTIAQAMANALDKKKFVVLKAKDDKLLSEYLEDYIDNRSDLSQKTLKQDKTAIQCFIDVVGDIKVSMIRQSHINAFRKIHEYYIGTGKKRVITKISVNSYLRHLKTFLRQAQEDGLLIDIPKIKMLKVGDTLPKILTADQRKRLLNYAFKNDHRFYMIMTFALFTGCRREEIISARWENYDRESGLLTVRGKGDKERQVPIIKESLFAMGHPKASGPIFWQVHPDTYTHKYQALATGAMVFGTRFHFLRHSAATQMLEKEIPLEIIQKILGHSDIKSTQIYAKVLNKEMISQMQKLSNG